VGEVKKGEGQRCQSTTQ